MPQGQLHHALLDAWANPMQDADPYVRKTAAVCVAKLYDINPELVHDQGFLDMLRDLLSDSNPMVVANAVAALSEIEENASTEVFRINAHNLQKLLAALNECTEWGQVRDDIMDHGDGVMRLSGLHSELPGKLHS